SASGTSGKWNCASGHRSQRSGNLHVVEISRDLRRATFTNRNARVSARPTAKNIRRKVVELNLTIRGNDTRARLAHVHPAHHAATDAQIRTRSITSGGLDDKHRFREFHVLSLAIRKLHCARVDISSRSLDSLVANGQSHTRDIQTSNLRTRSARRSDL